MAALNNARLLISSYRLIQYPLVALVLARLARGRRRGDPLERTQAPSGESISAVVPGRDEEQRLAPCLEPLVGDPDLLEVIVVDDESSDRTIEVAAAAGATMLEGQPLPPGWAGKAWALEQGLRAARGDLVLFLDADCLPLTRASVQESVRRRQQSGFPDPADRTGTSLLEPARPGERLPRFHRATPLGA